MPRFLLPAVTGLLALLPTAHMVRAAFPPHPTVLLADYKKAYRPIVAVKGTDPVIVGEDNREIRVRTEVTFAAERAPQYGTGSGSLSRVIFR